MPTMTPEIYEEKRNDLIAIIEGIMTKSDGLPDKTRKELQDTVGKLKRNSFEIVLVGEFQGGKSTTFDAICDGREISPRGIGIKTSACKISAQSIPADQDEHADLRWKTDDELMLTMLGIVKDNLIDDKLGLALFTKRDEFGNEVLPSLSEESVRDVAQRAIHAEWEKYLAKPAAYDTDNSGRLDLLQISTLILKYYGTPELESLRGRSRVTIDELKHLVVFPRDWSPRWQAGGENANWVFNEIPFVFLGYVSCYIHCSNLERLGCIITDCPGLFAGPWDTAVAQRAMMQADAILYLIGGDRTVTESDLRALSEIRRTQQGHKVFFAINARSSNENITANLRPVDFSMIKQRGFDLEGAEAIDVFNALLAFDAKTTASDLKSWGREVSAALALYLGLDLTDDDDIAKAKSLKEDLASLYAASDFASIINKIETSIIARKFESILVRGGTDKASCALDVLNGDLKQKEAAAAEDLAAIEKEAAEARKKLAEFQDFVTKTVADELGNMTASDQTAKDFVRVVYHDNVDEMAGTITSAIVEAFRNSDSLGKLGWQLLKSKLPGGTNVTNANDIARETLEQPIIDAMSQIVEPAIKGWICTLRDGQNDMFNLAYGRTLDRVAMMVRERWDSSYDTKEGFLSGLAPNMEWDISRIVIPDSNPVIGSINVEAEALRMLRAKIVAGVLGPICAIICAIIVNVLLAVFAGIILTGGILPILALIGSAAAFSKWFSDNASQKFEKRLLPEISSKLRDIFTRDQGKIEDGFKSEILSKIVGEMKDRCQGSLKDQLDAFNCRVEDTLVLKRMSLEEQKHIAEIAKTVRTEQIEPARADIAAFHNGLKEYFA